MPHPHWPLFDLVVRTPRITVRYIDDPLGDQLAALAAQGVHDPDFMPFTLPWTDAPSPDLERNALRWYWRSRADTRPESWNIQFAVFEGDQLVGTTAVIADNFPTVRAFETGSWLGRRFQGAGIGTEMRIATLHLGFLALDASTATTAAFADNGPSTGVTRKLGYEPNGVGWLERRGQRAEISRFVMSRQHFLDHIHRDDVEIEGDAEVRDFLGIARTD